MRCPVCFRHCELSEGQTGFCGARVCRDGAVVAANYGRITSMALDPIEKKPLSRFMPGSYILSVGSYGCNLRCPFCQNYEISWSDEAMRFGEAAANGAGSADANASDRSAGIVTPEEIADLAVSLKRRGNVGVAFTYNEPLIGYEFIRDTAALVHARGMVNVLVSNGTAELPVLEEILPYIDAMNIDLKGFTDSYYSDVLGGDRRMVMDFIERAARDCHMEVTTLIVPGHNDSDEEMRELSSWISGLKVAHSADGSRGAAGGHGAQGEASGREIPLHISRYFPRFHMTDIPATDVSKVYHLAEVARENLKYVYTGNC